MQLSTISLALTRLGGLFSPASLFAGGTVAGAWYDPSDLTTLFTSSAGTTQCAMPGQGSAVSVGLMLDKSQGLVLGSELVTNGDFSAGGAGWINQDPARWTFSGGAANHTSGGTLGPYQSIGTVVGKYLAVTFTVVSVSAGSVRLIFGAGPALTSRSTTGTFVERIFVTSGNGNLVIDSSSDFVGSIDNISVRELAGNHAIAANDSTKRPELSARVNLLRYSEQFDNAAWARTNATVTPNQGTAPDGTNTVAKIVYSGGVASYERVIEQNPGTQTAGTSIRFSIWARGENGGESLEIGDRWGGGGTVVLTTTLTRYSFTFSAHGTSNNFYLQSTNNNTTVYVWGAQVTLTNQFPANTYQRIADANTYDTSGFPLYLRFDGIDDSMYTPANLNLSGTDKVAVFAGVRKLSDAAAAILYEFSDNWNGNTGSFASAAPASTGASGDYNAAARGSAGVSGTLIATSAITLAPVTNVFTATHDIPGDLSAIRLNGAASGTNGTGDKGSGNLGTYPLFIGARNNSSLWFNGHLHSLIIAGSAVSAGNISATEQWVANKTGIVIP